MIKPQKIDILGAGIMGLMTAYELQKAGHSITIYDPKGFPANNASAVAGGMLAPYSEIEHMDMRWVQAGLAGINAWENIPLKTGFVQKGSLLVACNEDLYILERFKSHLPGELKDPHNAQELEPSLDKKFQKALFLSQEAHLNPEQTMPVLCEHLKSQIIFKCEAKDPQDCDADWVIDCRGMDSGDKNLRGVKGEIAIVRNPEFKLARPVRLMHPRYPLYIVPRPGNVFMIGATIIESGENDNVSLRSSMELMSALYALSPSFGEAEVLEMKAGIRPSYPDNLPRIIIKDNVIRSNGLFRHGFLLSPVMAACIANHIAGQKNEHMSLFGKDDHESDNQRAA